MNLARDIDSLTHFKRNTAVLVEQLKATGQPMVLTVNGKAEVVVQDVSAYQRMLDLIDRAEAVIGIKKGLESMEKDEGIPADEAFGEFRKRHRILQDA